MLTPESLSQSSHQNICIKLFTINKKHKIVSIAWFWCKKIYLTNVKIYMPEEMDTPLICPLSDGGCLAVAQTFESNMRAICFNSRGRTIWDRSLENDAHQGYLDSACAFSGNSFAVAVRKDMNGLTVDMLCRFSAQGESIWELKVHMRKPDLLNTYLLLTTKLY